MSPVRASSRRLAASLLLALSAALSLLAIGAAGPASAATCPSFRVLHNDRIGEATLPAGNYSLTVDPGLSCQEASKLFARFLADWDGNLPKPWRVVPTGNGKASFTRGGQPGFAVVQVERASDGGNTLVGALCPGSFTVNAGSRVGPLLFPKGRYLLYIPAKSAITCRRASVLFTRFLGAPGGTLPFPWRVEAQTATFFKPANPLRSAFRVEALRGVS
ncbi:MAG TPA: hypothetical protein VFJ61_10435 [Solirubrobacterales bacterium]|nr:hypothetical protein [Solirubrobacterales bacterium]